MGAKLSPRAPGRLGQILHSPPRTTIFLDVRLDGGQPPPPQCRGNWGSTGPRVGGTRTRVRERWGKTGGLGGQGGVGDQAGEEAGSGRGLRARHHPPRPRRPLTQQLGPCPPAAPGPQVRSSVLRPRVGHGGNTATPLWLPALGPRDLPIGCARAASPLAAARAASPLAGGYPATPPLGPEASRRGHRGGGVGAMLVEAKRREHVIRGQGRGQFRVGG